MANDDRSVWMSTSPLPGCGEVGWVHWRRAAQQSMHCHADSLEVHAFARSAQRYRFDETIVDVPAEHALIVPAGVEHGPVAGNVNPGECFWLRLDLEHPDLCRELPETDRRHVVGDIRRCAHCRVVPVGSEGIAAFRRLIDRHRDDSVHSRHLAHAALIELLTSLCMGLAPVDQRPEESALSPAIGLAVRRLRDAVGEHIAIEDLAVAAGLGMRTFHKRFVTETGYTPGQYRVRCRLDWAEQMLLGTTRSITDIAHSAGFASSQYFATVFRRHVGVSPQAFRERAR